MPTLGYVYALINPVMSGLVKIGKTTDTSESRARQISTATGVPVDFVVAFEVKVSDANEVERRAHSQLAAYRINESREFFRVELKTVISVLMTLEREFAVLTPKQSSTCSGSIEDLIFTTRAGSCPPVAVDFKTEGLPSDLQRAFTAAESGDVNAMVTVGKRFMSLGNEGGARKWLLEAAKHGRADVCGELGAVWPETGESFLQRLSLFWIAASAGDVVALQELSKYWPILPPDSIQQMRYFARKLNPKFECKNL